VVYHEPVLREQKVINLVGGIHGYVLRRSWSVDGVFEIPAVISGEKEAAKFVVHHSLFKSSTGREQ
jgi:hypothetical protein